MKKGIDVSYAQGVIDWDAVKASGVEFAILRCGYGQDQADQDDDTFARNVAECERVGIPYGVYFYAYAYNAERAAGEAAHCLRLLKLCGQLSYPVYYDLEDPQIAGLSQQALGDVVDTFCSTVEAAGYFVGTYASLYWYQSKLTDSRVDRYCKWVADWSDTDTYAADHGMWQYTSDGSVAGIDGRVDMNSCYVDYPAIINPAPQPAVIGVEYQVHLQDYGWAPRAHDGGIAGTTGESRRIEAVCMWLDGIRYRAHVEGIGWMDWVGSGEIAGTVGQSRRLEAVEIQSKVPLVVQEHVEDVGWLPETSAAPDVQLGTVGRSLRMEAIRIRLA